MREAPESTPVFLFAVLQDQVEPTEVVSTTSFSCLKEFLNIIYPVRHGTLLHLIQCQGHLNATDA